MMKLDGLVAFVAVADGGSISEAARRLALSKSVVSERLAELERTLGARLVQRTTRKLSLSGDGLTLLPRARRIIQDMTEAADELAERRGTLAGPLRLSGPASFGSLHLGPALYGFLAAHPALELTLDLDDRFVDVAGDGYDAVIRHGPIRDNRLVARRLATSRRVLVASPAYLEAHGSPASPGDLEQHRAVLYANRGGDWTFTTPLEPALVVRPRASLRVNNGLVMRDAALAGMGITLLPTFLVHRELAAGTLRIVDVGLSAERADVYLAHAREPGPSAKIRALARWLRGAFGEPPYWESAGRIPAPSPR